MELLLRQIQMSIKTTIFNEMMGENTMIGVLISSELNDKRVIHWKKPTRNMTFILKLALMNKQS